MSRNRNIFRYYDGTRKRGIDPIHVIRSFAAHPTFNADTHIALAVAEEPDYESVGICVQAVRDIFAVPPWHEKPGWFWTRQAGLTEGECLAVLMQFCEFVGALKKNTRPTPTGPAATELSPPTPSQDAQEPITSDTSACGSMSAG